jgi:integrase
MAFIRERETRKGEKRYMALVRLAGHAPQTKTFRRKTDAKEWAAQIEVAIRDGRDFQTREAKRHKLSDLVADYLRVVARDKPSALQKQTHLLNWWVEELRDPMLSNLTANSINNAREKLLTENLGTKNKPRYRSNATWNRYRASLSKAVSYANKPLHWMTTNPVSEVEKGREPSGRVRFLSHDERARLLQACRESPLSELELIVLLAITAGARRGEILGLKWQDLDLDERHVAVLHQTKNRERRSLKLVPLVLSMLKERAKFRRLDTDFVFPHEKQNTLLDPAHHFEQACIKAGITDFRFHDLRHTAASYIAMSGGTLHEIAAILGHKTLAMVQRYAHLSDAHTGAVVERMAQKYLGDHASNHAVG